MFWVTGYFHRFTETEAFAIVEFQNGPYGQEEWTMPLSEVPEEDRVEGRKFEVIVNEEDDSYEWNFFRSAPLTHEEEVQLNQGVQRMMEELGLDQKQTPTTHPKQ